MKTKTARVTLVIVFAIQIIFLCAIMIEKTGSPLVMGSIALILLLSFIAWRKIPHHTEDHLWEDTWLIAFVALGAVSTFWISSYWQLPIVITVGGIGVLASFIPEVLPASKVTRQIPTATYCGAFVGMTSPGIAGGYEFIFLASIASGILMVLSKNVFHGYGGKLGTIAFG